MGYTHYWTPSPIAADQWAVVRADMKKLFAVCKPILAREYDEPKTPALVDDETIVFNGKGDDGHETFWIDRASTEWTFCKTAQKPYDLPVTAVLIYLSSLHGYKVSSDGDVQDWCAGLILAGRIWPRLSNQLKIPSTLAD